MRSNPGSMNRPTRPRALLLGMMLGLAGLARAQQPASPADPAAAASEAFKHVVGILSENGLHLDLEATRHAVVDAVVKTADPAGAILTPAQKDAFTRKQSGKLYGLGLRISMTNGTPVIIDVADGSPAAVAGLVPTDELISIDDTSLEATDMIAALALLRGEQAATLHLAVRKANGETNTVELSRQLQRVPGVETAEVFPAGLCYIKINGLFGDAAETVLSQVADWSTNSYFGLVLDLRQADGRNVDGAAQLASLFAEPNMLLFSFRDADDQDIKVYKAEDHIPLGMPAMVLIDHDTSGAAEVLAASLKRSIRGAMLLGHITRGDPEIRTFIELSPDEQLYVATRRLVTADGTIYDGREGVVPDVIVKPAPEAPATEEPVEPQLITNHRRKHVEEEEEDKLLAERVNGDPLLRRAVDILLGLKALNIRGIQRAPDPVR